MPDPPPDRPYAVVNMATTLDGKVSLGGSGAGIGSRVDRRLMRRIRAAADALMVGAGTLRADLVDPRVDPDGVQARARRGLSSQPLAVAVSGSLDLDPTNRFLVNGPAGTLILSVADAPADRWRCLAPYARIQSVGIGTIDLAAALRLLRTEHGVRWLLCEGGPSLNQLLLDLGLVDELFVTLAPKLAGGHGPGLLDGPEPAAAIRARLELVSLHEHESELFARYRVRRD